MKYMSLLRTHAHFCFHVFQDDLSTSEFRMAIELNQKHKRLANAERLLSKFVNDERTVSGH